MTSVEPKWWFNLNTRAVEFGPQSKLAQRIGPYDSREAAEQALDLAAQRAEEWAEEEREEKAENDPWNDED